MLTEVLGWPLAEAKERLEAQGWQITVRSTLAPRAEDRGEARVVRVKVTGPQQAELTVVYVPHRPCPLCEEESES
ncbi:hypothetical protein [Ammonifex thiophilus]|uniref:PASTA domain-containing protein n=1 Tax=Ammonifex thiophilus TaxID=444093 RepID=A0A3D8P471_9THEO|nr:hypothetical protein [Ammonifex thiophilus]RDV82430.1 hypothetical protein DXX99_07455 [Ammonifex thiophilus]